MLQPLEDYILVEAIEEEKTSKSGIILPDSEEKPNKGKVLAVGAGKILENGQRSPMDVKKGDVVYFTKYAPDELEVDGKKYLVIRHSSLIAKEA
ncbi:MAG: co-chaperone GroES [bacterium]|nr:co-chaperone GroES [bacterium]